MSILLVSYDLKVPGRNYDNLTQILKTAPGWWHYLESTWLLNSHENADQWQEKIRAVMDANDRFFVVDITESVRRSAFGGWLPKDAWEWIRPK